MTTPAWAAPANGLPGDLDSTNSTVGINQFLSAHGVKPVYKGAQIVTPGGAQNFLWTAYGNGTDLSQPFTMSGTALGRVEVPLQPNGNGADVLVSLYADSGGSPNIAAGAICSTMLPAQYLNQVCAPNGIANAGALATSQQLTYYFTGGITSTPYLAPVAGAGGIGGGNSAIVSGSYISLVGGVDSLGVTNVAYTIQYLGGGAIAKGVSQPNLPVATQNMAICQTSTAIYVLGGYSSGTSNNSAVYSAAWNSSTGVISSWSSQTALPVQPIFGGAAIWSGTGGTFIYHLGGLNGVSGTTTALSSVYMASISNGQIGAWSAASALPTALSQMFTFVVGNWLIAVGGCTGNGIGTTPTNTVYYAPINASSGALGTWQTGPSLPISLYEVGCGWSVINTGDSLVVVSGETTGGSFTNNAYTLGWDSHGPASEWRAAPWSSVPTSSFHPLYVANGDGSYDVTATYFSGNVYYYSKLIPVPMLSVPLPATGLTNGATYHVVLRQFAPTSASDYVAFGTLDGTPLPAAAVTHGRYASGAWTSVGAGRSIPMSVFDQTVGGPVLHTWEDPSAIDMAGTAARWSSLLYNAQGLLWGASEITTQPNQPLNSNPTFTSGVSPWTATNGTVTQSAAQTHGGYPFSGLLTPAGGHPSASVQSELFPVAQTPWGSAQWCMAMGWVYSPTGWSTFSLSVNWYDSSQTLISTSSAVVPLTAATWTQVNNWFQPPATAAYGQLAAVETGNPTAANTVYLSNVFLVLTPETVGALTSAATVNYGTAPWPPVGVSQLN